MKPLRRIMKPVDFGQSDAAMNKLAGINQFPNASKGLEMIAELEQKANDAGYKTPFEYLKVQHEEAAGMPLEDSFFNGLTHNGTGSNPPIHESVGEQIARMEAENKRLSNTRLEAEVATMKRVYNQRFEALQIEQEQNERLKEENAAIKDELKDSGLIAQHKGEVLIKSETENKRLREELEIIMTKHDDNNEYLFNTAREALEVEK